MLGWILLILFIGIQVKFPYIIPALKQQGPFKRFFRNFLITGNGWGMFSRHAHWNKQGKEKQAYNTLKSAQKGAKHMEQRYKFHYSVYLCPRCGKYHLGRNRDAIKDEE